MKEYIIRTVATGMYWLGYQQGYTSDITKAHRYTKKETETLPVLRRSLKSGRAITVTVKSQKCDNNKRKYELRVVNESRETVGCIQFKAANIFNAKERARRLYQWVYNMAPNSYVKGVSK